MGMEAVFSGVFSGAEQVVLLTHVQQTDRALTLLHLFPLLQQGK